MLLADASFPRCIRLLNGQQFSAVFDQKQRHHSRNFSLHFAPNRSDQARLGLVVSKRVSKKAVERNRIKRQIRESFRMRRESLKHGDYVIVAKVGSADRMNAALRLDLESLWTKSRR